MKTPIPIKTAFLMLLLALAVQAEQDTVPRSWKSGATTATLSHDGTLTVSGNGAMDNYSRMHSSRWWKRSLESITGVVIEPGITHIGDFAFRGCVNLTSVTIPESVVSIGESAFEETGLTHITIPNSVTHIGESAFVGARRLTSVTIPSGMTIIGRDAFRSCSGLTSVTIPNSVTFIGRRAFSGTGLTSVTIPRGITEIDDATFSETALTSVTIPDNITRIGNMAFWTCTSLTSVTIPKSVTEIGWYAFGDCKNLTSITIRNPKPPMVDHEPFMGMNMDNACLYVPVGSVKAYRAAEEWEIFTCVEQIVPYKMIAFAIILTGLIISAAVFIVIKISRKQLAGGRLRP